MNELGDLLKKRIWQYISHHFDQMLPEIRQSINDYYNDFNTKIPTWVNECKTETKVGLNPFAVKKNAEKIVNEITTYVKNKMIEDNVVWNNKTFIPFVEERIKTIIDSTKNNFLSYAIDLNNIRANLDVLITDMAIEVTTRFLLSILGLLNPVIIMMIAGGVIINALIVTNTKIEKTIKDIISKEIVKTVNENAFDSVDNTVNDIKSEFVKIVEIILSSMTIKSMENNVNTIKVAIIGNFANGKITLINSLLGEEILPTYARPYTAIINEIKYGEEKKAVLHFKKTLPERLPSNLPTEILAHIIRYGKKNTPLLEVPIDRIENFSVLLIPNDIEEMFLDSPYEKLELFYLHDLLKDAEVTIFPDISGMHMPNYEYLSKADIVLFVLSAHAICGSGEMKFIDYMIQMGIDDIIFVINRFDLLHENKKEEVMEYAKRRLSSFIKSGRNVIFPISAKNALEGKIGNDEEKYKNSGIPELVDTLQAKILAYQTLKSFL